MAEPQDLRSWQIRKALADDYPYDTRGASIVGPKTDVVEVVPRSALDRLLAERGELREALKVAVKLIEEYEDPLTTPDVVHAVLDHARGVLAGGEEADRG